MRSDERLAEAIRTAEAWESDPVTGRKAANVNRYELPRGQKGKMSLSGNERNRLFLNQGGTSFADLSAISGLDSPQDGRSLAIWDFDRDGWQDIALVNTNTPVLNLFRNQIGLLPIDSLGQGNMVALRFVGGNNTALPSNTYSCRDGYGVTVNVVLSDNTLIREHRCGEGLAAQNTNYMLIGIGKHEIVERIDVQWPSGINQQITGVSAGDLVSVYENAAESADGSGFDRGRYIVETDQR